ncbi:MAG: hypothetical protein H6R17_919 [Proteobacteria bacterium]|nr:hypothetical protein [Pseudomonadota bacterium]
MLKAYFVELLKKNNKIRYGLIALLSLVLVGVLAYDRLNKNERIKAENTFDCPDLDRGCQIEVRNLPYTIKTDTRVAAGVPFVLLVEGGGVEMHALWKMKDVDVDPNFYRLEADGLERWKSKMTLPSSPQTRHDWVLHLEINARAVDINTTTH